MRARLSARPCHMPSRKTPENSYLACAAPQIYGKTLVGVFMLMLATCNCPLACPQEGRVMVHVQRPGASLPGLNRSGSGRGIRVCRPCGQRVQGSTPVASSSVFVGVLASMGRWASHRVSACRKGRVGWRPWGAGAEPCRSCSHPRALRCCPRPAMHAARDSGLTQVPTWQGLC